MRISYWSSDVCSADLVDMMDKPRRGATQMRHQPHIIDIALPDIREREGCGVGARKVLGEVRKAAVHRRPADIEELRLRQDAAQEQDVDRKSTRLNSSH